MSYTKPCLNVLFCESFLCHILGIDYDDLCQRIVG